eukprot:gene14320-26654_t
MGAACCGMAGHGAARDLPIALLDTGAEIPLDGFPQMRMPDYGVRSCRATLT